MKRATNSSYPNTGFEIFVPGLGLLLEQNPLADRPISLSVRRVFLLWTGQEAGICARTVFAAMESIADSGFRRSYTLSMSSDPLKLNDTARAEYHARWEAVETVKAQELAAMTEERAREIIESLSSFIDVPPDPFNGMGLVEQQTIFHGHKRS